jgi:L-amino acid N-acyltransferase YncA
MSLSSHRLRLAVAEDAPAIAGIYAPYVRTTTVSFELEPPGAAEMAERMAAIGGFHPYLVLELDGRVQGYAYASRLRTRPAYDWVAESSIYMSEDAVDRRLGRPLYRALLDLLALQGIWWVYGGIALPNPRSQRFHEALGFTRIGSFPEVGYKFGTWCEVEWWRARITSADPHEPPKPVRSIHDVELAQAVADRLALG